MLGVWCIYRNCAPVWTYDMLTHMMEPLSEFNSWRLFVTKTILPIAINVRRINLFLDLDDGSFKLLQKYFLHEFIHKTNEN